MVAAFSGCAWYGWILLRCTGKKALIAIRRARASDAAAIGALHVAVWRSAYAGILPDAYLAGLSATRLAAAYQRDMFDRRGGYAVFVAVASGDDAPEGSAAEEATIIGFASCGRSRRGDLADGEVNTLYLDEDYRDRGTGRRLMRAAAAHLRVVGCRSAMVWVLLDNPTQWFYRHLGGRVVARGQTRVGGQTVEQVAMLWEPIDTLLAATAAAPEA
jgi:GNAT superfamily N-acetyltransferase